MIYRLAGVFILLSVLVLQSPVAEAQAMLSTVANQPAEATTVPEDLTPEMVNALVSRLSDEEVRALLLDELNAQASATAQTSTADFGEFFGHATIGAFAVLLRGFLSAPAAIIGQAEVFQNFNQTYGAAGWTQLTWTILAAIAIGLVAELLVRRLVLRLLPAPELVAEPTFRQSVDFLARRFGREVLGVIVFYILAVIALNQLLSEDLLVLGDTVLFGLILLPRLVYTVVRFVLSPKYPAYRLVHTDDATAQFLSRHMVGLAVVYGLTGIVGTFSVMNGRDVGTIGLAFWFDLAFRLYLIGIIWFSWQGLVSMMRGTGEDVTRFEEYVAQAYPAFGISVVLAMWWVLAVIISYGAGELIPSRPDMVTMTLLLLAPAFDTLIRGLVHHLTPPMKGEGDVAVRAYAAAKTAYKRIGRVVVFGIVLLVIGDVWGLSTTMLANAGAAGRIVEALFEVSFVLIGGYLVYEIFTLFVNRKLADEMTAHGLTAQSVGAGEIGGKGGTRLSTVLPLALAIGQVAIVVVFGLIALSEMGVDTTPLLAGAGIAGLAIGFGAQKLVSDVVSGAFFLIDDAFRMGEYVETTDAKGMVEKISVRSMTLRHHRGPVFTIPYGEIQFLKNYSRDWGIMKLSFQLPFGTDQEKVRKIFKRIGQELLEHEVYGDYFIEPFKSQGVVSIDDVGLQVRGKFMAKPGKQFEIRKEVFRRVQEELEKAGIPFARREIRVAMPTPAPGEDGATEAQPDAATAAGAAAGAAAQSAAMPAK